MRLASLGLGRFFFPQRCLAGFFSWRDLWRDFYCKKHHIPWMINGPPLKVYFKLYPVLKLILTSICYCIIKLSISSSLCSTLQTWMIVLHRRSLRYLNLRFWGHFFSSSCSCCYYYMYFYIKKKVWILTCLYGVLQVQKSHTLPTELIPPS